MSKEKQKTHAQEVWPQSVFTELEGKLATTLLGVLVYSVVCAFIFGIQENHYLFMIVASVLSAMGAFIYVLSSYRYGATGKKSYIAVLMVWAGFIPYLFGCYLVAYQGFWGFKELSAGFSVWLLIKAIGAILLGYRVVNQTYHITEVDRKFAEQVKANPALLELSK